MKNLRQDDGALQRRGTRTAPEAALASTAGRGRVLADGDHPELVRAVRALMDVKYQWSDGLVVELARD